VRLLYPLVASQQSATKTVSGGTYTLGAVVTWADLLARSDIQIFSKAPFDKP